MGLSVGEARECTNAQAQRKGGKKEERQGETHTHTPHPLFLMGGGRIQHTCDLLERFESAAV